MKKDIPMNIGLLLGTVVLFFTASEILLRAAGFRSPAFDPPRIYRQSSDPRMSYELKPNMHDRAFGSSITTNSLGLRSSEPESGKPVIAVLGDSVAFGYGLEDDETIPARLQKLLPGSGVQNGGVPGYFLPQEAALYEAKMAPLRPAALILIFLFNDLTAEIADIAHPDGFIHPPDWTPKPPTCSPIEGGVFGLIPGRCSLDLHSALYGVIKKIVTRRSTERALREERVSARENPDDDPVTEEQLARYASQLGAFSRVLPPDLPRLFVIWPDTPMHALSRPRLKTIAGEQGFAVLDLYDVFGNDPETRRGDSIHPSPKTARGAAAAIRDALRSHRLLP